MNIPNRKGWISFLSNKYIFIGLIIFSITILTTINNYYFYDYVSVTNDRNAKKIEIMIDKKLSLCADNNISISRCMDNILSTLNIIQERRAYAFINKISIKDSIGNIIWEKPKYKHDKVTTLSVDVKLPNLSNEQKSTIKIDNVWSNSALMVSVYRSMTFSLAQVIDKWVNEGKNEAMMHLKTRAWFRSRPTLGYAIFTILLFLLYRRRELAIETEIKMKEDTYVKLEKSRIDEKNKNKGLQEIIDDLESKVNDVAKKIQDHDKVINPPLNTLKYDQFLALDPESVIFKCRKVAEKLVIQMYQKNIDKNDRIAFYKRIEALSKAGLIDSKIVGYINTIKAFGNLSAHPNIDNPIEFSKEDALMVSSTLVLLIEELEARNLLVE